MKEKVKLPKKFKADWIKALRSGEFKQTDDGHLKTINGYCCLGVACVVGGGKPTRRPFTHPKYTRVPAILRGENDLTEKLANMNDTGDSFKKIARWIETHL